MAKSSGRSTKTVNCSFCGRSSKMVDYCVKGSPGTQICADCVVKAYALVEQNRAKQKKNVGTLHITPKEIYSHLEKHVIGQDKAKKLLAIAVANHYKRLMDNTVDGELANVVLEKSNVLLVGPTGSGKTLLVKSLAEKLNVPFAIGDATTLTEAGYVGEDVENLLLKLLHAANWDLEAAQRGIIFIDEIDKLHKTGHNVSITRDVSGEGVQQCLLKMLEGYVCNIPPQGGRKHPEQQYIQMDTSKILFICGGSFAGMEDIIVKRLGKSKIGFVNGETTLQEKRRILQELREDDLKEYGLIPELIGRLPIIGVLDELGVEDLKRILTETQNALLKQYQKLLQYDNIDLKFTDAAIGEMAQMAIQRGTGARGLRAVVEDIMKDIMFDPPKVKQITVDEEIVKGVSKKKAA